MVLLSISCASSYSDSSRSGTSTPPSEFLPAKLYFLFPHLIDGVRLQAFVSKLDKGYGDKMLLPVVHEAPFDAKDIQEVLKCIREAIPDAFPSGKDFMKISEDDVFCFDDGTADLVEESSLDDFLKSHNDQLVLASPAEALSTFSSCSLRVIFSVSSGTEGIPPPTLGGGRVTLYLLERPQVSYPPLPLRAPFGVPTLDDWRALWAAWDLVTLGMIPPAMLHQKPIDLRHKCLFYIGHIPTKALDEPNTEPKYFTEIFERGIDPHVDNPDHCHRHSEVPEKDEDWPTLGSILVFRDRVRARLTRLYSDIAAGRRTLNKHIGRMLALTHEHEGWHVETLLYMLILRAGTETLPPPGFVPPPWTELAAAWDRAHRSPSTPTVTLGPAVITLGHDDCEGDDLVPDVTYRVAEHEFGWDNEHPARVVKVGRVRMEWRPVTNEEYIAFWKASGNAVELPSSWVFTERGIEVRTLYGPVPMSVAKHWPMSTSYDGLLAYAKSKGGRLPTEPELRLFLDMYDVGHAGGANIGFRHWHPVPATTGLDEHAGKGTNGGIWEWTSTCFDGHDGLFPTAHFLGYSTDFFDGQHQVGLGASYATIPRLAGRRSVRNFYQHNYPYGWLGARVVYDV